MQIDRMMRPAPAMPAAVAEEIEAMRHDGREVAHVAGWTILRRGHQLVAGPVWHVVTL